MRVFMVTTAATMLASSASAVTLVNGSFELGPISDATLNATKSILLNAGDKTSLPGWTVIDNNVDIAGALDWMAASGTRSVDLSGIAPGGIEQTLHDMTPGKVYVLSFAMSGSYDSVRTSANNMKVTATGAAPVVFTYDLDNVVTDMMYVPRSYTFTALSRTSTVRFEGLDEGDYGAVLDDVSIARLDGGIDVVPEPAVWQIMIVGLGATGTALRRRRPVALQSSRFNSEADSPSF